MQWIVPFCISVLFVMGKHQTTAVQMCVQCTNCPNATEITTKVSCGIVGCAIWKNEDGIVERGCYGGGSEDAFYIKKCPIVPLCNGDPVSICQQCITLEDCEETVCNTLRDECYVSRTDERRGCTSDGIYTNSDDFETCSTNNCNRVAHCVVCNSTNDVEATCLENPASFSKPCAGHGLATEDENCFRYEVDKETFQLGCTSAENIPTDCGTGNVNTCKKCGADDCNKKAFQTCYECVDCQTLDGSLLLLNCTDYDSTCIVAYNLTTKQTSRHCRDGLDPSIFGEIFDECSEPNCNGFEFPTHRQCYQNDDPDKSYCTSLNATRCFIQESTDGSTLNRGCDTDPGFNECHKFENCFVCDSDGCNKDKPTVKCAICTNVEECNEPKKEECIQAKFYDGCYMYQGSDGALEKGCWNELDKLSEAHQSCIANEASCQRCTGEFCNEMHCLECNSRNGAECVAGNGNVQYGFCPTGDKCRMFVDEEGYTVRGCSSKFEGECDNDNDSCRDSEAPASNGGPFPTGAIKCYKCEEDCDAVEDKQLNYCSQNDSGCYLKFDGNNITSRGCLSEVEDCVHDPHCHECSQEEGEGCNSIVPRECYNCSVADGADCVIGDAMTCKTVLMCAVYVDGDEVKRTCINDLDFCDRNPDKCCKENKCNDNDICATSCPDGKCYEVCSDNNPKEKCFRYQNQGDLQWGCIDKIPQICDTDAGHCHQCDENFCNEAELAECFKCTDCSTVDDKETEHCSNPKDMCFIGTNQDVEVVRGCTGESDLSDLRVIKNCSEAACNRDVIGTCYQCSDCAQLHGKSPNICSLENFAGCYTVQDPESRRIDRGCVSDPTFDDCKKNIYCAVCPEANCNTHEVRDDPLRCSTCSGQNCLDYTPAKQCENGTGLLDRCVTYTTFDMISFKGCLSDGIPEGLENDCYGTQFFCEFCYKDYCNTPNISCMNCSTRIDDIECISNSTALGMTNCPANGVCFTKINDEGHLHRGCYNDQENIDLCTNENPFCELCEGPECNVDIFPLNRTSCYQCAGVGCQSSELKPTDSKPCLVYREEQLCYTYAKDEDTVQRGCFDDESAPECDDKTCLTCKDSGCNDHETKQPNELSCVQCSSNSACEGQVVGTQCTKNQLLGQSDQCYTLFVRGLVIEKGCLSDLPSNHSRYEDCLEGKEDVCETCSENNCNRGMELCYKCNSKENEYCSELVANSQYLSECPANATKCFTLVDNDGYTQRGCVEADICEDTSLPCKTCQGKLCNDKILPEDRQRCYVCRGSQSECLEPILEMVKACPLYKPDDKCYTYFENSTWVKRDCLSNLEGEEKCGDECVECIEEGCNDQTAYQSNPLSCVTCEGEACSGLVTGKQCSKQILLGRNDYCYEYTDGVTVSKGCLSDLDEDSKIKEECGKSPGGLCVMCNYNICNGYGFDCISCDSLRNPECVESMSTDSQGMLEKCESRKCVTFIDDDGYTHKGCSNETTSCKQGDTYCFECDKSMCNNVPFPGDRLRCHKCDMCNELTVLDRPTACAKYNSDEFCFSQVIGDSINRGCLSDMQIDCTGTCVTCNSSGCNDHPFEFNSTLSCIQCYGARECQDNSQTKPCEGLIQLGDTDQCYSFVYNGEIIEKGCRRSFPECSDNDCEFCSCDGCNLVSMNSTKIECVTCKGENCGNELDTATAETCEDVACISYVSKEGVVSRGCLMNFQEHCSSFGSKHETCYEPLCNTNLFPSDRIKCYRCEDCGTDLGSPEICPTYLAGDGCYTALSDDDSTVSRGCISDRKSDCIELFCIPCYTIGCNDQNQHDLTTTEAPDSTSTSTGDTSTSTSTKAADTTPEEGNSTSSLACIRCTESNGIACAWGFQPNTAAQCPTDAETGCFTCRQSDDRIVRGCSSEQPQSECSSELTVECAGDGCNHENQRTQWCAICDTNCDGPNASYQVETCSGIVEYANRGCYLLRNERRIVIERGCVSTLSDDRKRDCNNSRDQCDICFSDGCNSAMMVRVLNGLITAAIVVGVVRSKLFWS